MKPPRSLVVLLATVSILVACSKKQSETAAFKGTMRFLGSGTAASLVRPLADAYGKDHPDVKFEIEVSNSSFGLGQVRSGATDIAMSIKKLGPDDKDLKAYTIARDGLCMLVNRGNAVEALTDDQIKGIFKGEITNWKNLGGVRGPLSGLRRREALALHRLGGLCGSREVEKGLDRLLRLALRHELDIVDDRHFPRADVLGRRRNAGEPDELHRGSARDRLQGRSNRSVRDGVRCAGNGVDRVGVGARDEVAVLHVRGRRRRAGRRWRIGRCVKGVGARARSQS
jgi:hypothetical protein